MKLLLAPHNDDETLFASFVCQHYQPLVAVVTDCFVQQDRTPSVSATQRREETLAACRVLGCPVVFLGIPDTIVNLSRIASDLQHFGNFDTIFAPMWQGGHPHHDLVHRAAMAVFPKVQCYGTYSPREPAMAREGHGYTGSDYERSVKRRALACYTSQHVWSAAHFKAAEGPEEFYSDRLYW